MVHVTGVFSWLPTTSPQFYITVARSPSTWTPLEAIVMAALGLLALVSVLQAYENTTMVGGMANNKNRLKIDDLPKFLVDVPGFYIADAFFLFPSFLFASWQQKKQLKKINSTTQILPGSRYRACINFINQYLETLLSTEIIYLDVCKFVWQWFVCATV